MVNKHSKDDGTVLEGDQKPSQVSGKEKLKADERNPLCTYNAKGEELLDSRPVALPVNFTRPIPLGERVRALVKSELLARAARDQDVDTFEEADDFNIPDDPIDPSTPFEEEFEPEIPGIVARENAIRAGQAAQPDPARVSKARKTLRDYMDSQLAKKGLPPRSPSSKEEEKKQQ